MGITGANGAGKTTLFRMLIGEEQPDSGSIDIGETVDIPLYKKGYYGRSPGLNPRGIIPVGPLLDFTAPHGRG